MLTFDKEYIVNYDGTTRKNLSRLYFNTIIDF